LHLLPPRRARLLLLQLHRVRLQPPPQQQQQLLSMLVVSPSQAPVRVRPHRPPFSQALPLSVASSLANVGGVVAIPRLLASRVSALHTRGQL
jgi:hypothetical protein